MGIACVHSQASEIVELQISEIDQVDGAIAPLLVAAAFAGGGFVLGVATGFGLIQMAKRIQ